MDSCRLSDMIEGAINLVRTGAIAQGERVVVQTDTRSHPTSVESVLTALRLAGAMPTVVMTEPLDRYANVPPPALEAMRACDTLIQMYPVFLAFSPNFSALRGQMKPGFKMLNVDDATPAMFASDFARYPQELIYAIAQRMSELIEQAHTLRVTAPNGTDFRCTYDPRDMYHITTAPLRPGGRTHFPTGSACVYAGELPAEGVLYLDCIQGLPGLLRTPVEWVIRDARVVEINGGPEADYVKQQVQGVANGMNFAEVMLSYHPKASLRRGMQDDFHWEINRMPSAWCGMGRGHRITAGVHVDGGTLNATAYLGDRLVIENGHLLCLEDADIRAVAAKHGNPDELLAQAF